MSWSMTKIVGLVIIPLMVASSILASLGSIESNSLGPENEDSNQIIDTHGRNILLGQGVENSEQTSYQMQDAIMLSQMSAINCGLVASLVYEGANKNEPWQSGTVLENDGMEYHYTINRDPNEGNDRALKYLWQADYTPSCVGAEQADITSLEVPSLPSLGDLAMAPIEDVAQGINAATEFSTCEVQVQMIKMNGHDMEGVYGRIDFTVQESFKLGEDSTVSGTSHGLWTMTLRRDDGCVWQEEEIRSMPMLQAWDVAEYVPLPESGQEQYVKDEIGDNLGGMSYPGIHGGSSESETGRNTIDGGDYDKRAGEIYMDVPLVEESYISCGSGASVPDCVDEHSYYMFCEGAKGYIQTNTIDPYYEQESTSSDADNEGAQSNTFTYIHITEGGTDCVDEAYDFEIDGYQIPAYNLD